MKKYKTIEADSLKSLNEQCNDLSEEGYVPAGNVVVSPFQHPSDGILYTFHQQWVNYGKESRV